MFDTLPRSVQEFIRTPKGMLQIDKAGVGTKAAVAAALLAAGKNVVLVAKDDFEYKELRALLQLFEHEDDLLWWQKSWVALAPQHPKQRSRNDKARSTAAFFAMAARRHRRGVLLTPGSFLLPGPPPGVPEDHFTTLRKNDEINQEMVLDQLIEWGYERTPLVSRRGEFSVRGDILDVFAPGYKNCIRLEFFGDTLEDIRVFDPVTQRSTESLEEVDILPAVTVLPLPEFREKAEKRWKRWAKFEKISKATEQHLLQSLDSRDSRIPDGLYYPDAVSLFKRLPQDAVYLLPSEQDISAELEQSSGEWNEWLDEYNERYDIEIPAELVFAEPGAVLEKLKETTACLFADLPMVVKGDVGLHEKRFSSFEEVIFGVSGSRKSSEDDVHGLDRPWQTLIRRLKEWERTRPQTILGFSGESSRKKFMHLAREEGILPKTKYSFDAGGLFALITPFASGIELFWNQVLILGEEVLQPRKADRPPVRKKDFKGLERYDDLHEGDLLVHRDYGLGRFRGLERMDVGDAGNDFLLIEYLGGDRLFLPVDKLSLIKRYKGPEDVNPALDRLGGMGWIRTREKARKAIEKIAKDLVEMYAYRRIAKGWKYEPINEMYREFEASFGFDETPDQGTAIRDVMRDMDRNEPMDRLICGDVGFGKTEVALRAAFRAVINGRQAALLCPTTVLAEQHYRTFIARLSDFPVNAAMISRFVSPAEQKKILKSVQQGHIDILIGTHRLLSADVEMPNLGLLILDEEQRFGVKHKERLKKLRKNVDVLTLTATPIPRTLQLSLSGIRGLSVIETPPVDRKPVETHLVHREPDLLKAALKRELDRGGQVFWVHNRVRGLEHVVAFVKKLAPEASVAMAHGQMTERELEESMHKFWLGECDILVCTAIVESGLDFPKANTLIVDQAQMFGLGQLYQLRGRVGRSDRQAYSYFVVPDEEKLGKEAAKRMKVLLDSDYLGAGFQIAMEDLRLRGAGNILGEVQSGHIARVGLDLYLEMLEEEVGRLKGKPLQEKTDPELNIGIAARIPESYIEDADTRLKYYKGLSSAGNEGIRRELIAEMRDRFGPLPPEAKAFVAVLDLKHVLSALQVVKADVLPKRIRLTWPEETPAIDPQKLIQWIEERLDWARLIPPSTMEMQIDAWKGSDPEKLQKAADELSALSTLCDGTLDAEVEAECI